MKSQGLIQKAHLQIGTSFRVIDILPHAQYAHARILEGASVSEVVKELSNTPDIELPTWVSR